MREFVTAVADHMREEDPSKQTRVLLDGHELVFNQPDSGQAAVMLAMGSRKMDLKAAGNFITLFINLADEATQDHLYTRLLDPNDPFELDSDGGVFDIWEHLTEEWSARPTKQPRDYQPPRRATGKASTARTRAKASTS